MNALSHYKTMKVSQNCWVSLLLCPVMAQAAPQGAQVVSGQAVIKQSSQGGQSVTTVTQTSNKATLNWQQFNVGPAEIVKFVQPGVSSVSINRISDPNGSRILGQLSANGQVWLINPAGVYFGPGAQVNVGGLVASTLNLADNTKPFQLQGAVSADNNSASVVNEGSIQTAEGGYAALLAGNVSNPGNITSPGGRILLLGDKQNGSVSLSGRLDTSSSVSKTPGFIETSASLVRIADTARVSTRAADGSSGEWLIDPTNFTISSGSGASTTSSIGASTLSTSLGSSNVRIATDNTSGSDSGNIYVNSAVSWSAATRLTLSAYKDIYINAPITSSNSSGKLKLMYGQGSTSGSISGVVSDYYVNAPVTLAAGTNFHTQLGSDTSNLKSYQVITGLGSKGSSTNNDRLLQVWHLGTSGARADSMGVGRIWLNLDLLWSYLHFNDTTAQTTDAAAADTQGHSNRLTLSAGRVQPLGDNTQLLVNWQAQWANKNLDTTQKMSFGGARSVRAYAPGVLSGDSGHLLTAEIKHRLTPTGNLLTVSGDLYASVFIDAGWLTLYQNPYASGSNQARLAGAGVGLSWEGPRYWRASFSVSQTLGNAPSQLSGSSYLHANAWLEVSKGFR